MWKQCLREHRKAPISDSKVPKSLVNQGKNRFRFIRDVEVASSNLVTSTIEAKMRGIASHFCFDSRYSNSDWFAKQTQVRIPKVSRSYLVLPFAMQILSIKLATSMNSSLILYKAVGGALPPYFICLVLFLLNYKSRADNCNYCKSRESCA